MVNALSNVKEVCPSGAHHQTRKLPSTNTRFGQHAQLSGDDFPEIEVPGPPTWLARLGTLPSGPMTKLDFGLSRCTSLVGSWFPFSPANMLACVTPTGVAPLPPLPLPLLAPQPLP